jgi:hypothetical protein
MIPDTRTDRATHYRQQAAVCRRSAEEAATPGARDDYLKMAGEWDVLANEVSEWAVRLGEGAKS